MSSTDPKDVIDNVDEQDIDQAADDIEEADVSRSQRFTATAYLIGLFVTIGLALVAAVYFGYIDPSLTVTGEVSVGWVVEYLVAGIVAVFLLFTAAMVLVAIPVSISSAIIRFAAGIAESGSGDDQ